MSTTRRLMDDPSSGHEEPSDESVNGSLGARDTGTLGLLQDRDGRLASDLAYMTRRRAAAYPDTSPIKDFDREKEQDLAATAHDLQNVLSIMKMSIAMQRRTGDCADGESTGEWQEWLVRAEGYLTRVMALVDKLFAVACRQTGHGSEPHHRPNDLVALTRQAAAEYQLISRIHRIRVEADAAELVGSWNSTDLMRVLDNLLHNAVKYSPDGGEIVLRVNREVDADGAWGVLAVCDHGLGIPWADLPHIFERFHRASNVRQRIEGTGIGLTMLKEVVEQHGGKVTVVSEEGRGSTFTVRLPLIDEPTTYR